MSESLFDPSFEQLPVELPLFPLTGVLLLPRGRLPLRVFEPRYLSLVQSALKTKHRMIGMIQPVEGAGDAGNPPLYRTGCAGRIVAFSEADDGGAQYVISVAGLIRFDIAEELPVRDMYRSVVPDWQPYRGDLGEDEGALDRDRLIEVLKPFFQRHTINADFAAMDKAKPERLVNALAMVCPFQPREKQALIEARDTAERARLLIALVEMALFAGPDIEGGGARH